MIENKFNYIAGASIALLLILVVALMGKVSELNNYVANLASQVESLSAAGLNINNRSTDYINSNYK